MITKLLCVFLGNKGYILRKEMPVLGTSRDKHKRLLVKRSPPKNGACGERAGQAHQQDSLIAQKLVDAMTEASYLKWFLEYSRKIFWRRDALTPQEIKRLTEDNPKRFLRLTDEECSPF